MTEKNKRTDKVKKRGSFWEIGMTSSLLLLLFRIPLSRFLGNEGTGYFGLSYEVYQCISFVFIYGLSGAVAELVSKRVKRGLYKNSLRVLTTGLMAGIFLALCTAILSFLFSDYLFSTVYGVKAGALSYKVNVLFFLPAVLLSCFRGYFEGLGSKMPTVYSKIAESLISGTGGIVFTLILLTYGKKVGKLLFYPQYEAGFGAAGTSAGYLCGIILSLIFIIIIYRIYQIPLSELLHKDETKVLEERRYIVKELCRTLAVITIPVLFLYLHEGLGMSVFIQSGSKDNSLENIKILGSYYGKMKTIIFLVITIILGTVSHQSKRIVYLVQKQKKEAVNKYIVEDLRKLLIFSLPAALLIAGGAKPLLTLLFAKAQQYEITMVRVGAFLIVIVPAALYFYRILSGINKRTQLLLTFISSFILQSAVIMMMTRGKNSFYSLLVGELVFWTAVLVMEGVFSSSIFGRRGKKKKEE